MTGQESRPWMTVLIATYNSARFLPQIAEMLSSQTKPDGEGDLEILAVDGGSTDGTRQIAQSLGFRVIENPRGDAIAAKHLGLRHATSRLVCVLDHDEVLLREDSLALRFEAFRRIPELRAVISAGYRFEEMDSAVNMYASEFGDPFSMVTYRCPNNEKFRLEVFKKRLQKTFSDEELFVFRAGSENRPILCEMAAGSGTVDIDFFRESHPEIFTDVNVFPHAYYLLGDYDLIGMLAGDAIHHESAEQWSVVRAKISWRVNNAVNATKISGSGFSGRAHTELYSPLRHALRFAAYAVLVLPPLFDSIRLAVGRRRLGYLMHFPLTYFVLREAIRLRAANLFGSSAGVSRYGEKDG